MGRFDRDQTCSVKQESKSCFERESFGAIGTGINSNRGKPANNIMLGQSEGLDGTQID